MGGFLGAAAVLSALLFLLRRRHLLEDASHRPGSAGLGADLPEYYDGESTWNSTRHEMYAPKPTYELGSGVLPELGDGMTPELGDGVEIELQDSSVGSQRSSVEAGVV